MMASLLVGSAVVGASLAPLSAQATTTGNTPVTAAFEGGTLPDGNGDANTVDQTRVAQTVTLIYCLFLENLILGNYQFQMI